MSRSQQITRMAGFGLAAAVVVAVGVGLHLDRHLYPSYLGSTVDAPEFGFDVAVQAALGGDSTKTPLDRGGWPDGTPQNSNLLTMNDDPHGAIA